MPRGTKPAPTTLSRAIEEQLDQWRERRGLSQRQLASLSGVGQGTLSNTLGIGKRALDTNELDAICQALQLDPADIVRAAQRASQEDYMLAALEEDHRPDAEEADYL